MSEKKKILFILHLPPPIHGAAVVGDIIRKSDVINSKFECRYINLATATGLGDIGHFKFNKISRFFSLINEIRRAIGDFRPDLIYITPNSAGKAFYKDWLTLKVIKRFRTPVIAHFHNKGVARNATNRLKRALYKDFFHNLHVILLSDHLKSDISDFVSPEQINICHNGLADIPYTANQLATNNLPPRVLFLSNLLIDKGLLTMLNALAVLKDRNIDFVCDIAGAETAEIDRSRLDNEIARRSLGNRVKYHGAVYGSDKDRLFASADVFVFPSKYKNEAFPLVCIEAMQHSLPIVASNEGGIPDMVVDGINGYICPDTNTSTLANCIASIVSDLELGHKMGENGRRLYEEKFTIRNFESNLCDILDKII